MLTGKELISILIATVILGFTASLMQSFELFLYACLIMFVIIFANIFAKKIIGLYLDSEVETKLWEIERWGFQPHRKFNKPLPAGAFFPIITTALSFGYARWMATLVFDVKTKTHRAAKRHGLYKFSEMTEFHIGLIAASGILINLILAVVGYLLNFPLFAKLNFYYAFYNMFPISDLDGNKIFFGSLTLWSFLASLTLIGLLFAILII